jgi:hypothetical protein
MDDVRGLRGSCHCGALRVEFRTAVRPEAIPVRACQCSFCRRHRTRTVADPSGRVMFTEDGTGAAVRYRFALETADYLICGRCGVYMGAVVSADGACFAIVNAPVLDEHGRFGRAEPVVYDHEDAAARLARRRANWTPLVGPLPGQPAESG